MTRQGHSAVNADVEETGSLESYKVTESGAPGERSDEHLTGNAAA